MISMRSRIDIFEDTMSKCKECIFHHHSFFHDEIDFVRWMSPLKTISTDIPRFSVSSTISPWSSQKQTILLFIGTAVLLMFMLSTLLFWPWIMESVEGNKTFFDRKWSVNNRNSYFQRLWSHRMRSLHPALYCLHSPSELGNYLGPGRTFAGPIRPAFGPGPPGRDAGSVQPEKSPPLTRKAGSRENWKKSVMGQ
jgi:hypothetical protein